MQIKRLLHVSRGVGNQLDAAAVFYADVLGLPILHRPATIEVPGLWLAVGDTQLHLNGRRAGPDQGDGPRPDHLCFAVDQLDAAVAELSAAGVHVVDAGSLAERQVWLRDPAGNAIELQQERT